MKYVSSEIEFDFKHDGSTTVPISDTPTLVSDEVAAHLLAVFGGRIIVSDKLNPETVSSTEETVVETSTPDSTAPAEEVADETEGTDAEVTEDTEVTE